MFHSLGADTSFDLDRSDYSVVIPPRLRKRIGAKFNPHFATQVAFDVAERETDIRHRIGTNTLQAIYVLAKDYIIPRCDNFFVEVHLDWRTECLTSPVKHSYPPYTEKAQLPYNFL